MCTRIVLPLSLQLAIACHATFLYVFSLLCKRIILVLYGQVGVRGSVVVKALCYKPEGRGFETR
jgi:hypothetical protein